MNADDLSDGGARGCQWLWLLINCVAIRAARLARRLELTDLVSREGSSMNRIDRRAPVSEALEPRRLLSSVTLTSSNRLDIVGDQASANVISVGYSPGMRFVVVVINGKSFGFRKDDVNSIRIFGGALADRITISEARAKFDKSVRAVCGAGDDTFLGGSENDVVFGDDGNDFISLGNGDDAAVGGNGNDHIIGGNDTKLIFGGAGDDVIAVGSGRGYIFGQDGNDAILTRGDRFEILGDAGADTITGHGRDTIWGGGGADVLKGGTQINMSEVKRVQKIMSQLMPVEPSLPTS